MAKKIQASKSLQQVKVEIRGKLGPYLSMQRPMGAMVAFIKLDDRFAATLDSLLEQRA